MMTEYTPDKWVILRMKSEYGIIDKILCGWYGGYLGSDEWKLSSGIVSIKPELDENGQGFINFKNESGSEYICYTNCEGMTGYMRSVLNKWTDTIKVTCAETTSVIIIPYKDWEPLYD